jgi:excisionase family DNA binding protein
MNFVSLPPLDQYRRYSVLEGAAYLGICRARVYQKIKSGELRVIKDGARTLIPGSEIARLSSLPDQGAA